MGWFLNHLPAILWQRKLVIILSFLALSLAAIIAAYSLPTIYRSKATLLVQSQELPSDIVDAPATEIIDRRIARIRERVLSRGDLIGLIEQFDLYSEERRSQPMSVTVEKMREATTVGALEGAKNGGGSKGSNTIAFNMAFDYPDPAKAQSVLQSYVTRFLQMDTADIEDQASLTVRFLQDQAGKLQAQITQIENQITALKAANGATLTGGGMPMMMDTGSYTSQITALEAQNRQLLAQARRPASANPMIAEAEAALAAAQARYSDTHPDVIAARERLATVRSLAQAGGGSSSENAILQEQINANNAAIASLTRSRNEALARVQAQAANQARAPVILEEAMQMENRASTLRTQYREVANNLLRAQNSARLASEQRAERLALVEPPSLPDTPESPNRPLLIAAGAIIGLVVGFVLALGLELLARPLRSPAQIENMGYPVIGVVPTIRDQVKGQKRRFDLLFRRRKRFA